MTNWITILTKPWDTFIAIRQIFIRKAPAFILMTLNEKNLIDRFGRHQFLIAVLLFVLHCHPIIRSCSFRRGKLKHVREVKSSELSPNQKAGSQDCCEAATVRGAQATGILSQGGSAATCQDWTCSRKTISITNIVYTVKARFPWTEVTSLCISEVAEILESTDTFGGTMLPRGLPPLVKGQV